MTKQRESRLVPLVGGLGILMIAAGIVVGTVQALRPEPEPTPAGNVPAIVVLAPQNGDTVEAPLELRFRAGDDLALGPMGWASADLHLHVYLDGTEIMPAAADIVSQDDGSFVWRVPVTPGTRTFEMGWAGMQHGAIPEGASDPVMVHVR